MTLELPPLWLIFALAAVASLLLDLAKIVGILWFMKRTGRRLDGLLPVLLLPCVFGPLYLLRRKGKDTNLSPACDG